jgi:magnesium-transporting ATPase (P-type)
MKDLDKKILDEICDKNICPKSSRYFTTLICIKAAIASGLIILTSIVLALELYIIKALREEAAITDTLIARFLNTATLATIVIAVLSLGIAIVLIRNMGRSYLYTVTSMAVFAGSLSIILAHAFDITGINKQIDTYVMGSYLEPFIYHEYDLWMQPQQGKLAGHIETTLSSTTFSLRDLDNNLWIVSLPNHSVATGSKIKLLGTRGEPDPVTMENIFFASATTMWR